MCHGLRSNRYLYANSDTNREEASDLHSVWVRKEQQGAPGGVPDEAENVSLLLWLRGLWHAKARG